MAQPIVKTQINYAYTFESEKAALHFRGLIEKGGCHAEIRLIHDPSTDTWEVIQHVNMWLPQNLTEIQI